MTGKQRSYLRKLAQQLDPVVYIGKSDMTENVLREMDCLLSSRELIKVKLQEGSLLDPKQAANDAAETLDAEFVQAIGRRFVLYRQAEDPEKRTIVLPR
ncbi:MAG: YhbY family RNA-binding protein [Firmicutes bacterium]|nr:YhbY family RNA-binding protein [Bacillota bacterium]